MSNVIQSLWVGDRLSMMEILSIRSFLAHDHEYVLYAYGLLENLPVGARIQDANSILPASAIFQYTAQASFAGFSNFFRYKLLLERGGWWADTDIICLQPFDIAAPFVFSSEMTTRGVVPASAVIKAPSGSDAMAHAWRVCSEKIPKLLRWGETGPKLIAEVIALFSLERYLFPPEAFCPIGYQDWHRLIEPNLDSAAYRDSFGIHLWNEMWRREACDKDRLYDPGSLYGSLQRRYRDEPIALTAKSSLASQTSST
jgi:hypothetical protein